MKSADKSIPKEQARYKRNFDARLRKPNYDIPAGSYVFLRKEQGTATEPKHKLAQVATGPYAVKQSDRNTVVIAISDQEERVSRDRVELAPSPIDHVPITGLRQALQFLDGTEENEAHNGIENDDRYHVRAPPVDSGTLVGDSQTTATNPQDEQGIRGSEERDESHNLRKGEENSPTRAEGNVDAEYVIDRIVDHGYQKEKLILKVKWYGYTIEDATWEPIEQLPRSAVVTYFRRKRLLLPAQIAHAQPG